MYSFWERSVFFRNPDVAIVGAGIVGLSAARFLKQLNPGLDIVVLERGNLPSGATTRNAGFACFGSLGEILDDLEIMSPEKVWELVKFRYDGLNALRKEIPDAAMDYDPCGGFEIFTTEEENRFQTCMAQLERVNKMLMDTCGFPAPVYNVLSKDETKKFGFHQVAHVIRNRFEGTLNSGKLWETLQRKAITEGIRIFTGMEVLEIKDGVLHLENMTIHPSKTLICTNGFADQFLKDGSVLPARGQVLVTEPIPGLSFKGAFHHCGGYNYFREIDGRILLGGGRHLDKPGETTTRMENTREIIAYLEKMLYEVILPGKEVKISCQWAGIMGVGKDKTPLIQEVAKNTWMAVRMGGMGVAIGTLVGKKAATMVYNG